MLCLSGFTTDPEVPRDPCSPVTSGLGGFQLSRKELGNGSEAVAHAEDVSALRAQDGGEGVRDALNLQEENMVKRVLHAGQLTHQERQAAPGSLLPRTMENVYNCWRGWKLLQPLWKIVRQFL